MAVKIRLARIGRRHDPTYRINVANSWAKRDGRYIEALGQYSSLPDQSGVKRVSLDFARTRYWLSVGAQPTETVARLLGKVAYQTIEPALLITGDRRTSLLGRTLAFHPSWPPKDESEDDDDVGGKFASSDSECLVLINNKIHSTHLRL